MLEYAKAYFNMPWGFLSVSLLPITHWLLERKPHLVALFYTGEADSRSGEKSTIHFLSKELKIYGNPSSNLPTLLPDRGPSSYSEKQAALRPKTRSWRLPRRNKNKIPDANYKKGDPAWLSVEGKPGAFKVEIDSIGKWNVEAREWQYLVRQTDGQLYEGGTLVGEGDLNQNEK